MDCFVEYRDLDDNMVIVGNIYSLRNVILSKNTLFWTNSNSISMININIHVLLPFVEVRTKKVLCNMLFNTEGTNILIRSEVEI